MSKSVTVEIDAIGNVKVEAIGFQGVGCKDATQRIRVALDGQKEDDAEKPEYYATSGVQHKMEF